MEISNFFLWLSESYISACFDRIINFLSFRWSHIFSSVRFTTREKPFECWGLRWYVDSFRKVQEIYMMEILPCRQSYSNPLYCFLNLLYAVYFSYLWNLFMKRGRDRSQKQSREYFLCKYIWLIYNLGMLRSYLTSLLNIRWFIDSHLERKSSSQIRRKSEQLLRRRISMEEKVIIISIIIIIFIIPKLAEVITEESNLREENRRMSIMIAEAEEVGTC